MMDTLAVEGDLLRLSGVCVRRLVLETDNCGSFVTLMLSECFDLHIRLETEGKGAIHSVYRVSEPPAPAEW